MTWKAEGGQLLVLKFNTAVRLGIAPPDVDVQYPNESPYSAASHGRGIARSTKNSESRSKCWLLDRHSSQ